MADDHTLEQIMERRFAASAKPRCVITRAMDYGNKTTDGGYWLSVTLVNGERFAGPVSVPEDGVFSIAPPSSDVVFIRVDEVASATVVNRG